MLSPAWPGRWNGPGIWTPWARMQWAKLTMPRSDSAVVSWPVVGGDEHAAASNPATTAPASAAALRFTARLSTAAYLSAAGPLGTPIAFRPVLWGSSWHRSALMARPPHHVVCR